MHEHFDWVLGGAILIALLCVFFVLRKLFDRRRGERFPVEEPADQS